ncbi:Holliday junction resolvase RuvX [Bacteroidota bacterium]
MGRILAIDFGLKRTGLAVTDPEKIIATPLAVVRSEDCVQFLRDYIEKETVETIVIGLPVDLRGRETHATGPVKKFITNLEKIFPEIPIHTIDERFTSKMALDTMIMAGSKKKDRRDKGNIDKISATIILQSYLEQNS